MGSLGDFKECYTKARYTDLDANDLRTTKNFSLAFDPDFSSHLNLPSGDVKGTFTVHAVKASRWYTLITSHCYQKKTYWH